MGILGWIVLGALAGWLASRFVRGGSLGILGDIAVGIVGGLLGGFVVSQLGGQGITGFNLWSLLIAFGGAAALLLLSRLIMSRQSVRHG
jgi:uncharacterized membrane protein YeaQ/YmgE (transglycosylase-associated protein family)